MIKGEELQSSRKLFGFHNKKICSPLFPTDNNLENYCEQKCIFWILYMHWFEPFYSSLPSDVIMTSRTQSVRSSTPAAVDVRTFLFHVLLRNFCPQGAVIYKYVLLEPKHDISGDNVNVQPSLFSTHALWCVSLEVIPAMDSCSWSDLLLLFSSMTCIALRLVFLQVQIWKQVHFSKWDLWSNEAWLDS